MSFNTENRYAKDIFLTESEIYKLLKHFGYALYLSKLEVEKLTNELVEMTDLFNSTSENYQSVVNENDKLKQQLGEGLTKNWYRNELVKLNKEHQILLNTIKTNKSNE